ncbi:hypothetical protein C4D60_Mb11t20970 [Musa balbisiana]|uniref:Uncharacterized protein n=1 Tax=Musa balbisiana TaxID=52838 RepID=A0A4V6T4A9_MUSBA|nr:hypothetical protein C4D60_Mb11t20970 [Musa balbisiana]
MYGHLGSGERLGDASVKCVTQRLCEALGPHLTSPDHLGEGLNQPTKRIDRRRDTHHDLSDGGGGDAIALFGLLELLDGNTTLAEARPRQEHQPVGPLPDLPHELVLLQPRRSIPSTSTAAAVAHLSAPAEASRLPSSSSSSSPGRRPPLCPSRCKTLVIVINIITVVVRRSFSWWGRGGGPTV